MPLRIGSAFASLCVLAWSAFALSQESAADGDLRAARSAELFEKHVGPLFAQQCLQCHGELQQESNLRLDQAFELADGGDRGESLVAGDASRSWLFRAIDPEDDELQMPPDGPALGAAELAAVREWIETGAVWPATLGRLHPPARTITDEDRAYWAFAPLRPVPLPELTEANDRAWVRNEIDYFTLAKMRDARREPLEPARRETLVRRLYFDLIGLPPSPAEVQAFVQNDNPLAYEDLVTQLLARPEYGERWARHWLDLVRYAESDGFKADVYRPAAWHFRDYVVRSLNQDKPYDRFLQEQLAGDELFPDEMDARIATGYLRLWPLEDNQKDVERQWSLVLQDVTEVTAEVVMAMGVRCARCHDHKYDPITQRDYYRLQAFFAAMLPRDDLRIPADGNMDALLKWEETTAELRQQMERVETQHIATHRKDTIKAYPPYLQAMYDKPLETWTPLDRQFAYLARPQIEKKLATELPFSGDMRKAWDELTQAMQARSELQPTNLNAIMATSDVGREAPPTYLADKPDLEQIAPGFLSVLDPSDASIESVPTPTTGRRATLAKWLTKANHPLTSRVIVNRIWQQHFGRGIVETANDFGRQGTPPTHPELLDWLAQSFVADGWSLKKLHQRIVTSATYQQSTLTNTDDLPLDTQLVRGWLPRRMDSEQIRDAMLATSGELQPYTPQPSVPGDQPVRSVQLRNVRNQPDEWLNGFDGPDMFNSCARRFTTTTPLQSLLVINSTWAEQRSAALANRLYRSEVQTIEPLVEAVYLTALSRQPTPAEVQSARQFFGTASPHDRERLTDFCHVVFCCNEFIYID